MIIISLILDLYDSLICQMAPPVSRALGILYGQFIGDALGSRYEFKNSAVVKSKLERDRGESSIVPLLGEGPFGYGPGVVTDDGEMAMSLLSCCLHSESFDPSSVACAYVRWAQTNPPDIGMTCSNALSLRKGPGELWEIPRDWSSKLSAVEREEVRKGVEENVRDGNRNSLSNGSLMRQSVLSAVYAANYFRATKTEKAKESLLAAVEADTLLTHCNPVAIDASKTFALLLLNLVKGKTPDEAVKSTLSSLSSPVIEKLLEAARERAFPVILPDGKTSNGDDCHIGYLGVALQVAVHLLLHAPSFSEGLIDAVAIGGDTDTNAAIAGALLGARFGVEGIPAEWVRTVEGAELRLEGENGIESFEQLIEGVRRRYDE